MKRKLLLATIILASSIWTSEVNAQDILNLGVNDSISYAIRTYTGTATDVTVVIPAGYTSPEFATKSIALTAIPIGIKHLTIKGDGSNPAVLIKSFDLPAASLTSFSVKGITLKGVEDGASPLSLTNYVLAPTSVNVATVSFEGCSIANFRGVVRMKSGAAFTDLTFDNCIIRNIGNYNLLATESGSTLTNYTFRNSTVYGTNGSVFGAGGNIPTTFTISGCTFDNVIYTSGKYFIDFGATNTTTTLAITNTILGKTVNVGAKGIRGGSAAYTVTNSFTTSDWVTASNAVTGFSAYANTAATLLKTPTTFDGANATASIGEYNIIDATFESKASAGDPRWYATINAIAETKQKSVTIYPNPTADRIHFNNIVAKIEVINLLGKTMLLEKNVTECSLVSLSAGAYIVRTTDASGHIDRQTVSKK